MKIDSIHETLFTSVCVYAGYTGKKILSRYGNV